MEAEDRLTENPELNDDLNLIKEQFHNHEKFMMELSDNQDRVGAVLEKGERLLGEQCLSRDEAEEVRFQMRLLRGRWENLRIRAMDRQTFVHNAIIKGQQDQIDKFRYSN